MAPQGQFTQGDSMYGMMMPLMQLTHGPRRGPVDASVMASIQMMIQGAIPIKH